MTQWEAVEKRISCRAFRDEPLPGELIHQLEEKAAALSAVSGTRICICSDSEKPAVKLAGAMFSGRVYCCAALIGGDDSFSAEKIGYFGQDLVLFATQLGLGTCWVAGTFDRKSVAVELEENERFWDVIPIGWPAEKTPRKQTMIRAAIRRKNRKLEEFVESELPFAELPEWVRKGAEAIRLGPSAVNQQPVNIIWKDGCARAKLWKRGHGLEYNDLGIAKKQFEVGAAECGIRGVWEFGDGRQFIVED